MKKALIFPGYMSQYVGMGKELYDEYRIVQEYFEEASNCSNVNFVKLCFASSDAELAKLSHAYMSLFLVGSSVFAILKEHNIIPDIVAGYNNGEVTSLFAGGCFSLPDGLYLLNKFCSFYEESLSSLNLSVLHVVGKTTKDLQALFHMISKNKEDLAIAFYDGLQNHIVVGVPDAVGKLQTALEGDEKVVVDYLDPEIGLHSYFMNSTIDQFKIYLEKVDFKNLTIPMISGIDGAVIENGEDIKDRFIRHFTSPFKFIMILDELASYDLIIVAAPSKIVGNVIKDYYPEKHVVFIEKKADVEALKEIVQAQNVTNE